MAHQGGARRGARRAFTLAEVLVVMIVSAVLAAIGVRQMHRYVDRVAAHAAVVEAAMAVAGARDAALSLRTIVAVRIDTVAGVLTVSARGSRLARHALAHQHGVHLATTRDSIAFDVRGLGYGAANFTLVARRGAAVDSLVTSRLGRTRY